MNWRHLRAAAWIDTRARFVASVRAEGTLADLGASNGVTLRHMAELRPDVKFKAVDLVEAPASQYPAGCQFHRADLTQDRLPWPDKSLDAITCMHLLEHLPQYAFLLGEVARLLKPGGRAYFETPHPKSIVWSSGSGPTVGSFRIPLNFWDDETHLRPVTMGALAQGVRRTGLEVVDSGTSRNWLLAAAYPLLFFTPQSYKKFTAKAHWHGWSAYLIAAQPL